MSLGFNKTFQYLKSLCKSEIRSVEDSVENLFNKTQSPDGRTFSFVINHKAGLAGQARRHQDLTDASRVKSCSLRR